MRERERERERERSHQLVTELRERWESPVLLSVAKPALTLATILLRRWVMFVNNVLPGDITLSNLPMLPDTTNTFQTR